MPTEKPTFKCGTFLPGYGPFNIPSYGFGDTVDSGNGQDPPTGGGDDDVVRPPPPPGGGDGGGIPPAPNPIPGRPPVPVAPGGGGGCQCIIEEPPTVQIIPNTPEPGDIHIYTWKQKCQPKVTDPTKSSNARLQKFIDDFKLANPRAKLTSQNGTPDKNCETIRGCDGTCPDIVIRFFVPRPPRTRKPTDSVFYEVDEVKTGGGLVNIDYTDKPVETNTGVEQADIINVSTGQGKETTTEITEAQINDLLNNTGELDLNNPYIVDSILNTNPGGIEDATINLNTVPTQGISVPNDATNGELFKDLIDSNLLYVLKNNTKTKDWDSAKAKLITPELVYQNLDKEVLDTVTKIKNHDGSYLNVNQIFSLIGTRVLDGTIGSLSFGFLKTLQQSSEKKKTLNITPSNIQSVNEVFALNLIEQSMVSIDPDQYDDKMTKIFPSWKVLSSDIDRFIPICIGEEEDLRLFVKDDNTFIQNEPLAIKDGDFARVLTGQAEQKLFTKSEKDHAFTIPEVTRQKVVSLLGEDPSRVLEVSALETSNIEYNYSMSAPRQNFYMLSCVLSSIQSTTSNKSSLLKTTKARFELVDTSSDVGLSAANEFIRYKVNHRVFLLDDEDLMIDYIEHTSSIYLTQVDVTTDSPKQNKTIPLITRQYPWYILVCPTNRPDINVFNSKSQIIDLEVSGTVTRRLKCSTSILPQLNKEQSNKFVRMQLDDASSMDVLGNEDLQARIMKIHPSDVIYQQTYVKDGQFMSAQEFTPSRKKTGLRLVKEIIEELDDNYYLDLNGRGKIVTEFDVFSRMNLQQYTRTSKLENFDAIKTLIKNGKFRDVKVTNPLNKASGLLSYNKSLLYRKKSDSLEDTFTPIKSTNDHQTVNPPTEDEPPSIGPSPL